MGEGPEIRLSQPAQTDLDTIWAHIACDNVKAADHLIDEVTRRSTSYAHQPELGETREDLSPNCRTFSVGNYVIYYRPAQFGMEILRVIHGARHVQRLD